jgi:hypothetical protein
MAAIQTTHTFPGKTPGDVYQAILQAAPIAGLQVWKRRDIAWLAMVRSEGDAPVEGNISTRPGGQVIAALSAAGADEAALQARAGRLFAEMARILG